ncbi:MAG: NADH-quinone oxidoreductase subunit M, partial [Dehalococcoidia bacterium]|nr:NADH-quinone oxidoreductase subunit M [Dehalococcoidia bacterium]
RKLYSATKFLLYTLAGSALMLAGFLLLGAAGGSFDIQTLTDSPVTDAAVPLGLIFWSIMLAFLVKLPVFPVHTWLPDAHTDAPTAVSVMLAGVLLKMGGYGILRIAVPLLPEVAYDSQTILATLAGISIIWGGVITLRQTDLKRLIAYSSVSHMGYVLLGVSAMNSVGFSGAAFQMFTHGTITGLLFVMVGYVYERTHTRQISEMSGLMHHLPKGGVIMVIAGLASLGLPALSGFVAELTVFLGALEPHPVATILGIFGVVLSSGYILWTVQRVFQGPPRKEWEHLRDSTSWHEWLAIAALLIPIVLFGVYPALLAESIESGILPIAQVMEALEELV